MKMHLRFERTLMTFSGPYSRASWPSVPSPASSRMPPCPGTSRCVELTVVGKISRAVNSGSSLGEGSAERKETDRCGTSRACCSLFRAQ